MRLAKHRPRFKQWPQIVDESLQTQRSFGACYFGVLLPLNELDHDPFRAEDEGQA
jgi:hypothetical protein